jgi:hypothetical protein
MSVRRLSDMRRTRNPSEIAEEKKGFKAFLAQLAQ